jgi:superfamily II DNA/RNA helicase
MKNTVTEQINLGCMYIPDYPLSDGGCAGSGVEVFIDGDGQEQEAPESDGDTGDGPTVFNNPRRTQYKKNCGCSGSTRRNIGRVKGQEAPRKGFMRLGVTKTIEYLEIKPTDEQKDLIQTVNKGLTDVIAKAERDRRIKEVAAKVVDDRITRITAIEGLINDINEAFSDKDEESVANVMLAVYYYLRSTAGQIKIQQTVDLLYQTLVKEKEPVIIWAEQKVVIKAIENALNGVATTVDEEDPERKVVTVQFAPFMVNGQPIKFAVISGSTPTSERAKIVADFQSGKIDLIVASKAMREGVTLTRSCRAIFSEFWWVPAWLMQAEDRIYRIGQKRDCKITYVVLPQQKGEEFESAFRVDGMDGIMLSMLRRKRAVTEALLGGEEFKTLTAEEEDDDLIDEEEEGDEGEGKKKKKEKEEGAEATKKAISKQYQRVAQIIKETGGKGMEITLDDVLTYLKSLGLKDTYYELTTKGKNPKLVEVTYKLKKPPAEIRKAKNTNVAEGIIIDFIHKKGQATNLQLIAEIKSQGLNNKHYLEALGSLGKYLIATGDGKKLSDISRSTLEWMQTTTSETGSTGSFRLKPIYESIVPAFYPPSKRPSENAFADLAIRPLVNQGYVSIKEVPREYKNNPGMQHLDRLIKNMEGPARKAGLPNRMISYASLLKRALDTDNVQDAIDYYADLSTLVGESEAAGIKTPKEVVKTMQTAYAALSRMVDV